VLVVAGALAASPAGAQAVSTGALDGASVVPPNPSAGTGTAEVTVDEDQLTVDLSFSGLGANSVGSHLHCCTSAGSNVGVSILFPDFPLGVTSGTYAHTFDLASAATYLAAFLNANGGTVAGARAGPPAGSRGAYPCVHTTLFGGGEIRSQLAFDSFADGFESFDILDWSASVP
jgi:hypothetical protein